MSVIGYRQYATECMRKGYGDADGCHIALLGTYKKNEDGKLVPFLKKSVFDIEYFHSYEMFANAMMRRNVPIASTITVQF